MTTALTIPANSVRLFTMGQQDFLKHNQAGLLPYAIDHSWEKAFSTRMDPNIPSLDESIAAGHGACWNRVRGVYAPGTEPMTVREPGTSKEWGSEPRGLDQWQSHDDQVPAIRKRTDTCRAKGLTAMAYVGGLPLDTFDQAFGMAQRQAKIGAMIRWVIACGFTDVAFDLTAIDSQEYFESPTCYLADELIAYGVNAHINAQPKLHPGILPWLDGRFGCVAEPEWLGNPQVLAPTNAGACIKVWRLWLQGSIEPAPRVKLANAHPDYIPIIDFQGLQMKGVGA